MPLKGYATRILVDGYDFSSTSNEIKIDTDSSPVEYYVFQQPAAQVFSTTVKGMIEHNGYFNGAATGDLEKELYSRLALTTGVRVSAVIGTDQTVPVAYMLDSSYNEQLTINSPAKELITVVGKWPTLTGQLYRGYQLFQGTISATGGQTVVDLGAIPASTGIAFLHVTTITGTASNAAITVQTATSSGFGSPTTRGTFSFSAIGGQSVALAAGDRYARINCTSKGGATSFVVCGIVGYSGVHY